MNEDAEKLVKGAKKIGRGLGTAALGAFELVVGLTKVAVRLVAENANDRKKKHREK